MELMMDVNFAVDLGREALILTLTVAAPALIAGVIVALIVAIVQAATGIQEQTIGLLPKIAAMLAAALAAGPWAMGRLVEFGERMFSLLP
jgi:flagellar biosynthesis protein FliQ